MNENYLIVWEKWKDPLGFDEEDIELDNDIDNEYDNGDENISQQINTKIKKIKCQILNTPFGLIPLNENTASGEIFNFWTGHTNFAITEEIANIIEDTEGVETLNIFTKYRFRIAIGKAFSDSVIMRCINNNVYLFLRNYVSNKSNY